MKPVVSMIPYANMAPYTCLGNPPDCDTVPLVPSESVKALLAGTVVAAAVPVGALPMLGESVEMIGNFGIAAKDKVESVMLFSKIPLEQLNRSKTVSLTDQSATSIRLLYLLLGYNVGFDAIPFSTDDESEADAVLLIGDEALVRLKENRDPHIIDLVREWEKIHHTPFVFARWVVRCDAPPQLKMKLLDWLTGIVGNEDSFIAQVALGEARRVGGWTEEEMAAYLKLIRRILDTDDFKGQSIFLSELKAKVPKEGFEKRHSAGIPPVAASDHVLINPRVDKETCIRLLKDMPMGELAGLAHEARMKRHPSPLVTYVMDTNPNYTNICDTRCSFCAFCKSAGDEGAYTLSHEELAARVRDAYDKGASTVLLQGGHNPKIRLQHWISYIRAIKAACPTIHIHPFSPPEILDMAKKENLSIAEILDVLRNEGIGTLPGGGAEMLVDDIRKIIAPKKCSAKEWLDVMAAAHQRGIRTTATMMFGHVEEDTHIAEHLLALRGVQDKTRGFSSFIPWSFKPGNSALTARVSTAAHPSKYVRIIALARLVLDNFDHIQSSWFSESERAGMLGLTAGADDFGGILVEENVLKTSGYEKRTTESRVQDIIREAGFIPARRDSNYNVLLVFHGETR
jgi:cyclic dehypoxanthinyl futalosine synthase